jgi:hypothetical protein
MTYNRRLTSKTVPYISTNCVVEIGDRLSRRQGNFGFGAFLPTRTYDGICRRGCSAICNTDRRVGGNSLILTSVFNSSGRLVTGLGLHSSLSDYKVPKEDLISIASAALGKENDPQLPKVVELLESVY